MTNPAYKAIGPRRAVVSGQPPRPPVDPLIGHLRQARRDPLRFFVATARDYGDVARIKFFGQEGYLVSHPDYVKQVLQENHTNYGKDTDDYNVLRWLLGQGLVTSQGDFWLRQRRLMQPAFHRKRVAALGVGMVEATEAMLQRWQPSVGSGRPLEIGAEMMRLTLHIVGRALFGLDLGADSSGFGRAITVANNYLSARFYVPFPPPTVPTPYNLRYRAAKRTLDGTVEAIIRRRRKEGRDTGDLLSMLLETRDEETGQGMDDRQMRDEVMTLLLAGHETTANALAWTWYLLSHHPEVEALLHAEVDDVLSDDAPRAEDIPRLRYTRAVMAESMRLFPPAWTLERRAMEPFEAGGFTIRPGTTVLACQYLVHRDPRWWPEPERFDPARWLEPAPQRPKFAYFPFGACTRVCVGEQFAWMEGTLALATIARRWRMRYAADRPAVPMPLITLRPRGGMPMVMLPRTAS